MSEINSFANYMAEQLLTERIKKMVHEISNFTGHPACIKVEAWAFDSDADPQVCFVLYINNPCERLEFESLDLLFNWIDELKKRG